MKKGSAAVVGLIIIIILAVGGYLVFHKKSTTSSNNGSKTSTSSTNSATVNNAVLVTKTDSTVGQYLAEPNGMPLYTYNKDTSGVSNCTGACLANWPAYQDTGSTTGLPSGVGTIKRSDNGQTQYTYNGMPLYTFVADSAGKVTGNGVSDFKIAKPAVSTSSSSSSSSSSTSSGTSSGSSSNSNYPY